MGRTAIHAVAGLMACGSAMSAQVTVNWDYAGSGAAGFAVYCGGSSGNYSTRIDVGSLRNHVMSVVDGSTRYCAVAAYDGAKAESPLSNEIVVTATGALPVVSLSAMPSNGTAPLTVTFGNGTSGTVTSWKWDFGDGTTSTLKSPSHTYSAPGSYAVSLSATNGAGTVTKQLASAITVKSPDSAAGGSSGLVLALGFDEGSGSTARDSSGLASNGVLRNASWTTGKFGNAVQFDGVSSWVSVPDSVSLNPTAGLTLQAWVLPAAAMGNWSQAIVKEKSGGATYYLAASTHWAVPVGGVTIGGAETMVRGPTAIPPGTWSHIALTYDGASQRLYVNGREVASRAQSGRPDAGSGPLRIGGNSVWGEYFKGALDEIRVYNRALSATEIQNDMGRAIGAGTQ